MQLAGLLALALVAAQVAARTETLPASNSLLSFEPPSSWWTQSTTLPGVSSEGWMSTTLVDATLSFAFAGVVMQVLGLAAGCTVSLSVDGVQIAVLDASNGVGVQGEIGVLFRVEGLDPNTVHQAVLVYEGGGGVLAVGEVKSTYSNASGLIPSFLPAGDVVTATATSTSTSTSTTSSTVTSETSTAPPSVVTTTDSTTFRTIFSTPTSASVPRSSTNVLADAASSGQPGLGSFTRPISSGAIAGAVIGSLLFLLLVISAIAFCYRRRRKEELVAFRYGPNEKRTQELDGAGAAAARKEDDTATMDSSTNSRKYGKGTGSSSLEGHDRLGITAAFYGLGRKKKDRASAAPPSQLITVAEGGESQRDGLSSHYQHSEAHFPSTDGETRYRAALAEQPPMPRKESESSILEAPTFQVRPMQQRHSTGPPPPPAPIFPAKPPKQEEEQEVQRTPVRSSVGSTASSVKRMSHPFSSTFSRIMHAPLPPLPTSRPSKGKEKEHPTENGDGRVARDSGADEQDDYYHQVREKRRRTLPLDEALEDGLNRSGTTKTSRTDWTHAM